MDQQQLKFDMESSDQNKSQPLSTSSIINIEQKRIREDIPQTTSSLLPSQGSHISNLFPLANGYEDEQHIAHPIDQRLAISSSGTSGKATTITEPTIAQDIPLLDETGVTISQFRRSETPHPFEYKASADLKEQSDAILRTTIMAMSGHNEETQETPINVNHVSHQQSRGIKQTTTSISQICFTTDYAELDESAIQLDQLQRLESPQPVTYKAPADIQPSTGTILKTPSALGQEEPTQETFVTITQLRQPTIKDLSISNTTKQQVSSIMQPSATTDVPILNETAVHLDQVHRPDAPQTIQYKPPAGIQPSISFTKKTASTLSQEEPTEETSINIAQFRLPASKDLSATGKRWCGCQDI